MKEINTQIEINTSPDLVWEILADFENFPNWNPFIQKISGKIEPGSELEIFLKPPESRGMTIKPKIIAVDPGKKLIWLGKLWISKIVDGEHSFIIKKIDTNKVLFIQKEVFKGILVPFISRMLDDTTKGFEMMNEALKQEAELSS